MGTCRLCLGSADINIFFKDCIDSLQKFMLFTKFKIKKDDGYPQQICLPCLQKVEAIDEFIIQCEENDKKLRSVKPSSTTVCKEFSDDIKPFTLSDDTNVNIKVEFCEEKETATHTFGEELKDFSDKEYEKQKNFKKLKQRKEKPKNYNKIFCTVCGEGFQTKKLLNKHIGEHHRFLCELCLKKFTLKFYFDAHMLQHETGKLVCKICNKMFTEVNILRKHVKYAHDENQAKCPKCPFMARNAATLRAHHSCLQSKTKKKFICDMCQKESTSRKCFILHIQSHSGSRPYGCRFCKAKFTDKGYARVHERLHTGETPHKCPICLKGFAQSCNMKSHFKHNHGEFNFKKAKKLYRENLAHSKISVDTESKSLVAA